MAGKWESLVETLGEVGQSLLPAVAPICAILPSQLRSFLQPLAIRIWLPLAFELGAGAEFRAPMARAVIGGLITSTLLTLIVVPVVYTYLDDLGERARRWWGRQQPVPVAVNNRVTESVE